jgi:Leucine-rich repeat (LRR) protein
MILFCSLVLILVNLSILLQDVSASEQTQALFEISEGRCNASSDEELCERQFGWDDCSTYVECNALNEVQVLQRYSLRDFERITNYLGSLPSLTTINLRRNSLHGTIPLFTKCERLQFLDLSSNELSGSIPSFSNCPNLLSIILNDNPLSGSLPSFAKMPLTTLNIVRNNISGLLPRFYENPRLKSLFLSSNALVGSLPETLQNLDLGNNRLTGTLPLFSNLTRLETTIRSVFFGRLDAIA